MTLKEILGENYREDMTVAEISEAISKLKLADLSKGEYVAKGKLTEAEGKLTKVENDFKEYKASKQTEEENMPEKNILNFLIRLRVIGKQRDHWKLLYQI